MSSTEFVINEKGTQLIPREDVCSALSVQTIGSHFAPNSYRNLFESINFQISENHYKLKRDIHKSITYEDITNTSTDQQIVYNSYSVESYCENVSDSLKIISLIDDKLLPKLQTKLKIKVFLNQFIDRQLLECEKCDQIIDEILKEFEIEYILTLKVSIIDYLLKSEKFNYYMKFSEKYFIDNIHTNSLNEIKRNNMSFNYTFDQTIVEIIRIWNNKYRNIDIFEFDCSQCLTANQFKSLITQNSQKMNFKLKYEWISDCNQVLLNMCLNLINYDSIQNIRLFNTIASLMSKLLRELILNNLENWINILNECIKRDKPLFKIDIKCRSRGKPYFVPTINEWEKIFTFPLLQILEYSQDLDRVENNLILVKNEIFFEKFLFRVEFNDRIVQDYNHQILSIFNKIDVNRIIEEYELAYTQKVTTIINEFENFDNETESIEKLIEKCDQIILESVIDSNERVFGIFQINFEDFKTHIKVLIESKLKNRIEKHLFEFLCSAKHICKTFSKIEQDLLKSSNSSFDIMNNFKKIKSFKSKINLMVFDINFIEDNWNLIVENGSKLMIISESDFELMHKLYYWPKNIETLFNKFIKRIETERYQFVTTLGSRIITLNNKIRDFQNVLLSFEKKRISSPFECISDNCEELNDLKNRVNYFYEEFKDINLQQEELQLTKSDFPILTQLEERRNRLDYIWRTASLFQQTEAECMSKPFYSVNIEEVRLTIEKLLENCDQINIRSDDMLDNIKSLQKNIKSFKDYYIPLVEVLASPILRERHWIKIDEIIGQKVSPKTSLTLAEVISISHPKLYIKQITSLGKIARKEYELEILLEKMKEEWVDDWPLDALEIVANKLLEVESIDSDLKQKCAKAFKYIYLDSKSLSEEMIGERESCRPKFYVTPPSFIEVILIFKKILKTKQDEICRKQNKFLKSIEKLDSVLKKLKSIRNQMINDFQPILMSSFIETENLMIGIEKKTLQIEIEKEIIATDEAIAVRSAACAQQMKDECHKELSEAIPTIKNAINALNTLRPEDITILRSMKCPPKGVKTVLEVVCILNGFKPERKFDQKVSYIVDDYWSASLRMLSDVRFLDKLKNFDRNRIDRKSIEIVRQKYIHSEYFEPSSLTRVSNACEGLAKWVKAIDIYDRLINVIKPKRMKLSEAENQLMQVLQTLDTKKNKLRETTDFLQQLKDEFSAMSKKKKELEDNREKCRSKLLSVQNLINDLKAKRNIWTTTCDQLKHQKRQIVADLILSSAFIVFTSALLPNKRYLCLKRWQKYFENECDLNFADNFNIIDTLGQKQQILEWIENTICYDPFDVENALISQNCRQNAIIVNSNREIIKTLKYLYPDSIEIENQSEDEINGLLIRAFERGEVVIFVGVNDFDSNHLIRKLIESQFIDENEKQFIRFGEQLYRLSNTFKSFIISQNIMDLTPKILSKVTTINWVTNQKTTTAVDNSFISELRTSIQNERQLIEDENQFIQIISNDMQSIETMDICLK